MKRTTIFLHDDQAELLAEMSKDTGVPQAEIIRRAFDEYFQKWVDKQNSENK